MHIPEFKPTTLKIECFIEPTEEQVNQLVTILGRPLTEVETQEIVFTVTGLPVFYESPEEGGYCEDVTATYLGFDIIDVLPEAVINGYKDDLYEAGVAASQDHYGRWEAHLEDEADNLRKDRKLGLA